MIVQGQRQIAADERTATPPGLAADSPFLMEADEMPSTATISPEWVEVERIAAGNRRSPQFDQVLASPFGTIAETPQGRAQLVEGLRTENPSIFKEQAARQAALQALGKYIGELEVQRVCIEELETHPEFERSCYIAAQTISLTRELREPSLADRLTLLALNFPDGNHREQIMNILKPSLDEGASNHTVAPIIADVTKAVIAGAVPNARQLHALALSGNQRAYALMGKIALGTLSRQFDVLRESTHCIDLDGSTPMACVTGGAGAVAAVLCSALLQTSAIPMLAVIACGGVLGVSLTPLLRYFQTRKERLVRNAGAQTQAIQYLGLASHHAPMLEVLLAAKQISERTPALQSAFTAAMNRLNLGWNSVGLARALRSPLSEVRREAARRLGTLPAELHPVPGEIATVQSILTQLKSDQDPEVRKIAYQAARH